MFDNGIHFCRRVILSVDSCVRKHAELHVNPPSLYFNWIEKKVRGL